MLKKWFLKYIFKGFSILSQLAVNLTNRVTLKRKEGIKKVKFDLKIFGKEDEAVETDEDCTNLQLDLEECILKVVSEKH